MLLKSFETGDPNVVYQAAQLLVQAYKDSQRELAETRFKLNFGGPLCQNCEGLRAGPDVIATCFQVRLCNFSNVKESSAKPRHLRIISEFMTNEP